MHGGSVFSQRGPGRDGGLSSTPWWDTSLLAVKVSPLHAGGQSWGGCSPGPNHQCLLGSMRYNFVICWASFTLSQSTSLLQYSSLKFTVLHGSACIFAQLFWLFFSLLIVAEIPIFDQNVLQKTDISFSHCSHAILAATIFVRPQTSRRDFNHSYLYQLVEISRNMQLSWFLLWGQNQSIDCSSVTYKS